MNDKFVTSLELSKRLKELGVKQESEFWWWELKDYKNKSYFVVAREDYEEMSPYYSHEDSPTYRYTKLYSAFLSDELLEMLPSQVDIFSKCRVGVDTAQIIYSQTGKGGNQYNPINFKEEKLCDSLAKMLIYLINHNLMGGK